MVLEQGFETESIYNLIDRSNSEIGKNLVKSLILKGKYGLKNYFRKNSGKVY